MKFNSLTKLHSGDKALIEVNVKNRMKIQHLFQGMHDSIILTCLQGYMGRAWADNLDNAKAALIMVADFCFIAGDVNSKQLTQMIEQISVLSEKNKVLVIAENNLIGDLIEKHYSAACRKIQRYAIKKRNEEFDLFKLKSIIAGLPKEYLLSPIDGNWYEEALREEWSRDFVSSFQSQENFIKRGIGRIITHNGKIVSGASSYTIYKEGIEIEIDTLKEYRRQGLAKIAGAALIIACREKGLYPSWDAANMESVHLAEQLGYEFNKQYDTFEISKETVK